MESVRLQDLAARANHLLTNGLLPFWMRHTPDSKRGGFYGEISDKLQVNTRAAKGSLLTSRILWSFSSSYLVLRNEEYRKVADIAYEYLMTAFRDKRYPGFFWLVDADGEPTETRKQVYGQAFAIYALTEYFKASRKREALNEAIDLFHVLEERACDTRRGGYFEAYTRDWKLETDLRLTPNDMNEKKSMNTHLHILEAYTNLLKEWNDKTLSSRLEALVEIFLKKIVDTRTNHLRPFFDEEWTVKSDNISFGHDIEASWLLTEASEVIDNERLTKDVAKLSVDLAQAVCDEGMDPDGGVLFEADKNLEVIDSKKEWWVQCEAVIGYLNAFQLSGRTHFADAALRTWGFIEQYLIDPKHGECVRYVTRDRVVKRNEALVNNWKCPYHDSRLCLEVMKRLSNRKSSQNVTGVAPSNARPQQAVRNDEKRWGPQ